MRFHAAAEVDAFYDVVDAKVDESGSRWYFLVNYENCDIASEAWDQFAERGKRANIAHGLGTVRFGASGEVRDTIRSRAQSAAVPGQPVPVARLGVLGPSPTCAGVIRRPG